MPDRYADGPHGTTCDGCAGAELPGQCCTVLQLPFTQDDIRRKPPDAIPARTRTWYLDDLRPIGWREAQRRAPWLAAPSTILPSNAGQMLARYPSYYLCRHFDADTGRCGDHANRPDVCRNFPYYGRESVEGMKLPPGCAFRADIGEPIEWTPVELGKKES